MRASIRSLFFFVMTAQGGQSPLRGKEVVRDGPQFNIVEDCTFGRATQARMADLRLDAFL